SSADGKKLAAGIGGVNGNPPPGPIYVSTDSGLTWVPTSSPVTNWSSVACSWDGTTLLAVGVDFPALPLYISTNSGSTWETIMVPSSFPGCESSVACSADASVVLVGSSCIAGEAYGSTLFVSTNAGTTWTSNRVSGWPMLVSCSAGGQTMVAASDAAVGNWLLLSRNSGTSWEVGPHGFWNSIACSGDATTMLGTSGHGGNGPILFSTDGGHNWTNVSDAGVNGRAVAVSADGIKMALVGQFTPIFTSHDSGITWAQDNAPATNWSAVACSADGSKLVAAVNAGGIYTWQNTPSPNLNSGMSDEWLLLSWTVPSIPFRLEQSPNPFSGNWTPVAVTPTLNYTNLRYEVRLSRPGGTMFYRLASW
ncbi:MAG: hypothetical protein ACREIC_26580, partial [Limisphaerales bacterium]